jgi:hypothetical protein
MTTVTGWAAELVQQVNAATSWSRCMLKAVYPAAWRRSGSGLSFGRNGRIVGADAFAHADHRRLVRR